MELSHIDENATAHLIQRYIDGRDGKKYLTVGLLKGQDPSKQRSWFLVVLYPSEKATIQKPEKMRKVDYGYNIPFKYQNMVNHMKRELLDQKKGMI